MSNYSIVPNAALTATADAIRTKSGSQATIEFDNNTGFKDAVDAIPSGGWTDNDWFNPEKPTGDLVTNYNYTADNAKYYYLLYNRVGITGVTFTETLYIPDSIFKGCSNLVFVKAPKAFSLGANTFQGTKLQYAVFPSARRVYTESLQGLSTLLACDFGGTIGSGDGFIRRNALSKCTVMNVLVLRSSNIWPLSYTNVFDDTPFASGKSGGTLYVPADLVSSYQSTTNWSTVLAYANNQIKSIESTHTDLNAPIDLTLYYADGTLIPTE